jgi:hypothetical protein
MIVAPGATSVVIPGVFLGDSSSTTGAGLTGLVYNTAGLTCYYKRSNGTASVAVSLADISTLGTFASGGFKAIDGTNMPGAYEFHPPDAAFASGATSVEFYFRGATNLVQTPVRIDIGHVSANVAQWNGTAIASPDTAGYPKVTVKSGTGTGEASLTSGRILADAVYWNGTAVATPDTAGYPKVTLKTGTGTGEISLSSGQVTAVTSATDWLVAKLISGQVIELPTSGTQQYEILIAFYNESSQLESPDSAPTIAIAGSISGTSLNARLDSTTMTAVSTGLYRSLYTSDSGHSEEQLRISITATEGAVARTYYDTIKIRALVSSRMASGASITLAGTQTFNNTGTWTGNLSGSVGSVTGSVGSVTGNVGGTIGSIVGTTGVPSNFSSLGINASGHISRVTLTDTLTTYTGNTVQTGDSYARLGAPAAASVSADIVNLQTDATAIKAKTDAMTFTVANVLNCNATYIEGQQLSSKAGDNFNVFFHNANGTTTSIVDDVATGGAGTTDWTAGERNQIRYRLGLDGTAAAPSASPNLGTVAVSLSGTQTFNMVGTITGNITGNLSGSVGSVTGAVASVTAAVTLPTIDGIAATTVFQNMYAQQCGLTSIVDNGDGTKTISFKRTDDSTTAFAATVNQTTLARTVTTA